MDDKRKMERHHIQAAKEWLDGAERSLEGRDEVRGDLRVMLAKAELAHVGTGKHVSLLRCVGAYLLPVALAGIIAAGIVYGLHQGEEAERPEPPAVAQKGAAAAELASEPRPAASAEPQDEAAAAEDQLAPAEETPQGTAPAEETLPLRAAPSKAAAEDTRPIETQPSKRAYPPDAETQKLMQTAGMALRK